MTLEMARPPEDYSGADALGRITRLYADAGNPNPNPNPNVLEWMRKRGCGWGEEVYPMHVHTRVHPLMCMACALHARAGGTRRFTTRPRRGATSR